MHVSVDQRRRIAAGQCALHAPAVFDQNEDDGVVFVIDANPAEGQRE
jgi:ferredoxin